MVDVVYEQSDMVPDLPEFSHYEDEGCELADSCLNCPFSCCAYDLPGGGTRLLREFRNNEIMKRYQAGATVKELVKLFRVSRRTIERVISRYSESRHDRDEGYQDGKE